VSLGTHRVHGVIDHELVLTLVPHVQPFCEKRSEKRSFRLPRAKMRSRAAPPGLRCGLSKHKRCRAVGRRNIKERSRMA
jgi:hypothetical protein